MSSILWAWSLLLISRPTLSNAFSFSFQSTPQQCSNLTVSITGSGGKPPYSILILPFGRSPLGNVEVRKIISQSFDSSSLSFMFDYPTNSQFVTVVSDSSGFGTGGTSAAAVVQSSNDASCFDTSKSVSPDFVFGINPPNQIVQCAASRLYWLPADVQGTPTFYGVIPGGDSFMIPQGPLSVVSGQGTGFNWNNTAATGTTVILGAGDDRGLGSGGSVTYIVSAGLFPDGSCINGSSPSSTAGNPAGGSYPTGMTGGGNGSGAHNTAAIAGGVVGGIVGAISLLFVLLFCRRRRRFQRQREGKERPDIFNEGPMMNGRDVIADDYQPEPYIMPTTGTADDNHSQSRYSTATETEHVGPTAYEATTASYRDRPSTPATTSQAPSTTRKSAQFPTLRPVNIIQHDDAGVAPPVQDQEDLETVELPPAYTNLKRGTSQQR